MRYGAEDGGVADQPEAGPSNSGDLEGLKGRAKAFHLSGQDYISNEDVIVRNREEKLAKTVIRRREQAKANTLAGKGKKKVEVADDDEEEEQLMRVLVDDDDDEEDPVLISDLPKLEAKYGSRVRLRCSDEEIYYRLTGTHQKVSTHCASDEADNV